MSGEHRHEEWHERTGRYMREARRAGADAAARPSKAMDALVFVLCGLALAMTAALVIALFTGCATRGSFPGAKSADIIACREYASHYGAVWENLRFNECMEEAGYVQR